MTQIFRIRDFNQASIDVERRRVTNLLSAIISEDWILEVGSTAVDGVIGKQDLDFAILVPPGRFEQVRAKLDDVLKRNPDQISNEMYQGYTVESDLDVALQLTVAGGPYDTFLEFLEEDQKGRSKLICDPCAMGVR